jgi:hypothetical protein
MGPNNLIFFGSFTLTNRLNDSVPLLDDRLWDVVAKKSIKAIILLNDLNEMFAFTLSLLKVFCKILVYDLVFSLLSLLLDVHITLISCACKF